MKTTLITCDRCGVTVEQSRTSLDVRSGPLRGGREAIDLCGDCGSLLLTWLAREGGPAANAPADAR